MKIEVIEGSLLDCEADVIVNPANSGGRMGGGVAGVIRRAAGKEVEAEAMKQAPIPIGAAVMTGGGKSRFKGIIHAPTMVRPAEVIPVENVRKATRAALDLAEKEKVRVIGFPGMGTGVGKVSPDEAARDMIDEMTAFQGHNIQKVILVAIRQEMFAAWRRALSPTDRSTQT
ncbi:MAG: macro domain-containing protein [Nitrospiria bacterium]